MCRHHPRGDPGAGKNAIFDFFRIKVLGNGTAKQFDSAVQILEKHSTALCGTVFLQLDEADGEVCCHSASSQALCICSPDSAGAGMFVDTLLLIWP